MLSLLILDLIIHLIAITEQSSVQLLQAMLVSDLKLVVSTDNRMLCECLHCKYHWYKNLTLMSSQRLVGLVLVMVRVGTLSDVTIGVYSRHQLTMVNLQEV